MGGGKVERRQAEILGLLQNDRTISVPELCKRFDCCPATIRGDLSALESQGRLRRVLNGAVARSEPSPYSLTERENANAAQKRAIAEYVVEHLITPRSTIILDAGTTVAEVARALRRRDFPVSVLTSSLLVSAALMDAPSVRLYSFGGFLDRDRCAYYDDFFGECVKHMRADLFLMGVNGVSAEAGLSIAHFEEVPVKSAYMRISDRTVALCDSSKLGRNAYRIIADFGAVGTMVTDAAAPGDQLTSLQNAGLEVLVAGDRAIG